MSSNDDWLFDPKSNRFIQTYLRGYLDISGGDVILRNNNIYVKDGDISLNGKLLVNNDASFNSKMFVANDVSMNEFLFLGKDASFNSKLFVADDVCMNEILLVGNDVSLNSKLFVADDVCMNELLLVGNDVSFNSKLFVAGDVSINETLHVGNDTRLDSKLYVVKDVSFDSILAVNGDVSLNSKLYVAKDVSLNSKLYVLDDVSLNSKLYVAKDVSLNSKMYVGGDVSLNSKLYVAKDVSLNSKLYVGGDVSLNSELSVAKDVSLNSKLYVLDDVSMNSELYVAKDAFFKSNVNISGDLVITGTLGVYQYQDVKVINTTVNNYELIISEDISLNGKLYVSDDVSFNSKLFVAGDVSMDETLHVGKDVIMDSTLLVQGDASFNSQLFVNDDVTVLNGSITANDMIFDVSNLPLDVTGNFNNNQRIVYSQFQGTERIFNGVYDVSASSFVSGYEPWKVFTDHTGVLSTANWRSVDRYIPNNFDNLTFTTYTNLSGISTVISGEYVEVTLPFYIRIKRMSIACNQFSTAASPGISQFVLLGEVNGSWSELIKYNENDPTIQISPRTINIPTNILYTNKIRIVINKMLTATNYAIISELGFYGDVIGSKVAIDKGNLGIGTTNPRSALEVTGDILISNASTGKNLTGNDIEHGRIVWNGISPDININPSTYIRSYFENNTYDTSGNLAFGTSADSTGAIDRFVIHATGKNEFISDVSINSGLMVNGDVSFNSNLYVVKGVSMNSILTVSGDVLMNSKLTVSKDVSFNSKLTVSKDVSMNSKLTVSGDVSMNSKLTVTGDGLMNSKLTVTGDGLMNSKLTVTGNVLMNSTLSVAKDVSVNSKFTANGDGVMNSKLKVSGDVSMNSKLTVSGDVSMNSKLTVSGDVLLNSKLITNGDVSLNSKLTVSGDVSFNSKLTVSGDVSLNSKLDVAKDASFKSNLYVAGDVSMNKLFVGNGNQNEEVIRVYGKIAAYEFQNLSATNQGPTQVTSSYAASVIFGNIDSSNSPVIGYGTNNTDLVLKTGNATRVLLKNTGETIFYNDVSMNSKLYIGNDVSFNSKLTVKDDVSFNSNLYVAKDVSFNSKLTVKGDVSFNSNIYVAKDVSFNSKLTVNGDVSFNSKLAVKDDVSFNSNLTVSGDLIVFGKLDVNEIQNTKTTNTTVNDYTLIVSEDLSLNGNMSVSGNANISDRIVVQKDGDVIIRNKNIVIGDSVYLSTIVASSIFSVISNPSNSISKTFLSDNDTYTVSSSSYNTTQGSYSVASAFVNNLSTWKSNVMVEAPTKTYRTISSDEKQLIYAGDISTNYYNPTNNAFATANGEWIELNLPYAAIVDAYEIRTENFQCPSFAVLLGYDYTNTRWQLIHIYDNTLPSSINDTLFKFDTMLSSIETKKYRFVITQINRSSNKKLTTSPDLDGNISIIYDHNVSIRYINFSGNIKDTGISIGAGYSQNTANTSMGFGTLAGNKSGKNNIAIGNYTLSQTQTSDSIAIGYNALVNNQLGLQNVVIGTDSQVNNTAGSQNVAVGHQSGYFNTGFGNTFIGHQSGYNNRDGSYNTYIGFNTGGSTNSNFSNSTAIGANATITGNNQIVIGTANNNVRIPGTVQLLGGLVGDVSFNDKLVVNKGVQLNSTLRVAKNTKLAGALDVSGILNIQNQLIATNTTTSIQELSVRGSTSLQSTTSEFTVNGPSNIKNTLNVDRVTTLNSTLTVTKTTTLNSTLTVTRSANIGSRLTVTGDVSLNAALTVKNNLNILQNLSVDGVTQLNTLNTSGNTEVNGIFTTYDNITFKSNDYAGSTPKLEIFTGTNSIKTTNIRNSIVSFYDDESNSPFMKVTGKKLFINQGGNISSTVLDVTGIIETNSVLLKSGGTVQTTGETKQVSSTIVIGDVSNGVIFESLGTTPSPYGLTINTQSNAKVDNTSAITIDASGNMTISRSLQIDSSLNILNGNARIKYLDIINDTSLNTLYVAGNTSLNATLLINGDTTVRSTLDVSGATSLKDTLYVTEATTLNSTLDVSGATTLNSTLDVSGATTMKDTLYVANQTTLDSHLDISGNISAINSKFTVNNILTDISNIPLSITGGFTNNSATVYSKYPNSERVFNGTYDVSASTSLSETYSAWNVFDTSNVAWRSLNYYFSSDNLIGKPTNNSTITTYYNSNDTSLNMFGEYIDVTFPFSINLTKINIRCDNFDTINSPSIILLTILYKSTDDKWKILTTYNSIIQHQTGQEPQKDDTVIDILSTNLYSNKFRLIASEIGTATNYACISKLSFDGDILGSKVSISDGNIGIGNIVPRSALEVTGDITLSNVVSGENTSGTEVEHGRIVWSGIGQDISHNNHSSYIRSYFKNGTFDTSGNLAFGTSDGMDVAKDKFIIHSNGVSEFMTDVSINKNLFIAKNLKVNTLSIDNNLFVNGKIGMNNPNPKVTLDISASDAIRIPVGSTSSRPTNSLRQTEYYGSIRYNTTNSQFEGYGPGGAWGSLGGVINVSQNTKILAADPTPDSSNNQLTFYTNDALRMIIESSGDVSMNYKLKVDGDASFNSTLSIGGKTTLHRDVSMNANVGISGGLVILGDASIGGKTALHRDVSMNANVGISGDLIIKGNLSVFQTKQTETINTTINDYTLIITEDISLNGTLISSKDISINSITVGRGSGDLSSNTVVGYQALYSNTTGSWNSANGYQALFSNTTGNDNVATGYQALLNNTTGGYNVANGYWALLDNTTGNSNVANGSNALCFNTTGNNNTATGYQALVLNTTGNTNTANGAQALRSNTTGNYNTANGSQALYSNTTGNDNTSNGFQSLLNNTTGNNNTANGRDALRSNTTGIQNVANGFQALYSNIPGNYNTANGSEALRQNTTGNYNTANGSEALRQNTTGNYNTANGSEALYSNTTGNNNATNGYQALYKNTTGQNNTANGMSAGYDNTTASNNTFIGATTNISPTTANWTNSTAIGFGALITASNQIVLGRSSEIVRVVGPLTALSNASVGGSLIVSGSSQLTGALTVFSNATFSATVTASTFNATSDYRIKNDVVLISDTSYNVDKLRPVTYTNTISNKQDIGLIAHELQEEFPFLVTGEKDGEPNQTVNYTGLIGVLINEIQQLKQRVNELERSRP